MNTHSSRHDQLYGQWRYATPAILLHWLLALLVTGMMGLGWYMMSIEDEPNSGWYFDLHKSVGLLVVALVLLRLLWRAGNRPEKLPASLPQWQVRAAAITHWLLYTCLIVMPLAGLIGAALSKHGIAFFGLALPVLVAPNHDLSEQFFDIHSTVAWVLTGLVALHVASAIKHAMVDHDGVFKRMWF
jgi:cytochrome b561